MIEIYRGPDIIRLPYSPLQLCVKREMSEGLGAQSFAQEERNPLQAEEFELDER
jgi:hypothetical protein